MIMIIMIMIIKIINNNDSNTNTNININLREFACANERHPWDVRGKVGSERKFASSEKFAKIHQISPNFGVDEIVR